MKKVVKYKLNIKENECFPFLPVMHDNELKDIVYVDGSLKLIATNVDLHDDNSVQFVGFVPKTINIDIELLDGLDCEVIVSKFYSKKQINEKNNFGYGTKSNIYSILEFMEIKDNYNLTFSYNLVGYSQVNFIFIDEKNHRVEMRINCKELKYTFHQ